MGDLGVALAARGHAVTLLTDDAPAQVPRLPGVEVVRVAVRVGSGPFEAPAPESAAHNLMHAAAVYREVRRIHEEDRPIDAVLAPLWRSEGALCILDDRFPTIVSCMTSLRTLSELDPSYREDHELPHQLRLEREALRRSRYLHGLTAAVLEKTVADYGLRPAASAVIARGLRDRCPAPTGAAAPARPIEVLFVGRLEHRKGADVLLAAARRLAEQGAPVRFTFAGPPGDGSLLGQLEALRETVSVAGVVSDQQLEALYRRCDVVCLPSRYESHGIALVEAMMFGRAIVSCSAGGISEVIDPGRTGLLAPPDEPDALAQLLGSLAADPPLRTRLGAAAREEFLRRFEVGEVARQMESFISQVIAIHSTREVDVSSRATAMIGAALGISGSELSAAGAELLEREDPVARRTRERLRASGALVPRLRHTPDLCAIVVAHDRPELLRTALDSLRLGGQPVPAIVVDNGSAEHAASRIAAACAQRPRTKLVRLEENVGCVGGRARALALARSELIMFLDDDAELLPGALEHLVADLEAHPDADAVTATVLASNGNVANSGGTLRIDGDLAMFSLLGADRPYESSQLPPSGVADWVGGGALLARRRVFESVPLDEAMSAYYEDNEWSLRVRAGGPARLRRSREALVLHHLGIRHASTAGFPERAHRAALIGSMARFYARHGLLLAPAIHEALPELRAPDGSWDIHSARLVLELARSNGAEWLLSAWNRGELGRLLGAHREHIELARLRSAYPWLEREHEEVERLLRESGSGDLAALEEKLAFLYRRHLRLERIERQWWWRLRRRFAPAARARGVLGHARRGPAPEGDVAHARPRRERARYPSWRSDPR
jgi:glycosyltransferase involved in cell wall biosynthesis/GT2 family glycosyltransferase